MATSENLPAESDDVQQSLELLDRVLLEFEDPCRVPEPPPPPEEAARLISEIMSSPRSSPGHSLQRRAPSDPGRLLPSPSQTSAATQTTLPKVRHMGAKKLSSKFGSLPFDLSSHAAPQPPPPWVRSRESEASCSAALRTQLNLPIQNPLTSSFGIVPTSGSSEEEQFSDDSLEGQVSSSDREADLRDFGSSTSREELTSGQGEGRQRGSVAWDIPLDWDLDDVLLSKKRRKDEPTKGVSRSQPQTPSNPKPLPSSLSGGGTYVIRERKKRPALEDLYIPVIPLSSTFTAGLSDLASRHTPMSRGRSMPTLPPSSRAPEPRDTLCNNLPKRDDKSQTPVLQMNHVDRETGQVLPQASNHQAQTENSKDNNHSDLAQNCIVTQENLVQNCVAREDLAQNCIVAQENLAQNCIAACEDLAQNCKNGRQDNNAQICNDTFAKELAQKPKELTQSSEMSFKIMRPKKIRPHSMPATETNIVVFKSTVHLDQSAKRPASGAFVDVRNPEAFKVEVEEQRDAPEKLEVKQIECVPEVKSAPEQTDIVGQKIEINVEKRPKSTYAVSSNEVSLPVRSASCTEVHLQSVHNVLPCSIIAISHEPYDNASSIIPSVPNHLQLDEDLPPPPSSLDLASDEIMAEPTEKITVPPNPNSIDLVSPEILAEVAVPPPPISTELASDDILAQVTVPPPPIFPELKSDEILGDMVDNVFVPPPPISTELTSDEILAEIADKEIVPPPPSSFEDTHTSPVTVSCFVLESETMSDQTDGLIVPPNSLDLQREDSASKLTETLPCDTLDLQPGDTTEKCSESPLAKSVELAPDELSELADKVTVPITVSSLVQTDITLSRKHRLSIESPSEEQVVPSVPFNALLTPENPDKSLSMVAASALEDCMPKEAELITTVYLENNDSASCLPIKRPTDLFCGKTDTKLLRDSQRRKSHGSSLEMATRAVENRRSAPESSFLFPQGHYTIPLSFAVTNKPPSRQTEPVDVSVEQSHKPLSADACVEQSPKPFVATVAVASGPTNNVVQSTEPEYKSVKKKHPNGAAKKPRAEIPPPPPPHQNLMPVEDDYAEPRNIPDFGSTARCQKQLPAPPLPLHQVDLKKQRTPAAEPARSKQLPPPLPPHQTEAFAAEKPLPPTPLTPNPKLMIEDDFASHPLPPSPGSPLPPRPIPMSATFPVPPSPLHNKPSPMAGRRKLTPPAQRGPYPLPDFSDDVARPRRPLPSPPESDYGFTREPGTSGLGSLKTRSVDAGLGRGLREQLATSISQAREIGGDRRTLPMELSGATPRRHAAPPPHATGIRQGKKKSRAPTVPPHASLPETPVFTRGCDIPRAPYKPVGIPVLRSSLSEEGDRLVLCGPARGWYPKQRQNKAARSTENLDQASSLWGEPRKPQTLPPNLQPPKFFHRSPREALRRVTSLLIRRGNTNKEPRTSKDALSPNGASGSHCETPQRQKRSFFRSFWKKSKHYSLEQ